jgi:hypothetical protein
MVDDVDMLDRRPAHLQCETDVPIRLRTTPKDGECLDVVAARQKTCGAERRAEGRECAGLDQPYRLAIRREEVDYSCRSDALY